MNTLLADMRRLDADSIALRGEAYGFALSIIAEHAAFQSANGTRNRERAEKFLTAESLSSRSPVHAMVTRGGGR